MPKCCLCEILGFANVKAIGVCMTLSHKGLQCKNDHFLYVELSYGDMEIWNTQGESMPFCMQSAYGHYEYKYCVNISIKCLYAMHLKHQLNISRVHLMFAHNACEFEIFFVFL